MLIVNTTYFFVGGIMEKLKNCVVPMLVLTLMLLIWQNVFASRERTISALYNRVVYTTEKSEYKNYTETDSKGGGVFLVGKLGELDVSKGVKFYNNSSIKGGAISQNDGMISTEANVIFENNSANSGGAIELDCSNGDDGSIYIGQNATFKNNKAELVYGQSATGNGGAININSDTQCYNYVCIHDGAKFIGNSALYNGGAICCTNIGISRSEALEIEKNTKFDSNKTINGAGGAIYLKTNSRTIIGLTGEVEFINNYAKTDGGAIYNNGNSVGNSTVTINSAKFLNNEAQIGGAIYNGGKGYIVIEKEVEFSGNKAQVGGAIYNASSGYIDIWRKAKFDGNQSSVSLYGAICNNGTMNIGADVEFCNNQGALENHGTMTIKDGASFINNKNPKSSSEGAIYNTGILNLTAKTNDIVFTDNNVAIYDGGGTVNLIVNDDKYITFNDKITSYGGTSILNINQSSGTFTTTGKIILNEDMTGYTGAINFYNGTIELGENGKWFNGNTTIANSSIINMANSVISAHNFKRLTIADNADLQLIVDADLANGQMDTISATSVNNSSAKITVNKINILSDIDLKEITEIAFANNILKDKVESITTASSALYNYTVEYDKETGTFKFLNSGAANPSINMGTSASVVLASVGGYATQSIVANQVFASMDGKVSNSNNKASIDPSNLYVSAGDQVFDNSGKIERGLWLRPFVTQETVKIGDAEIDNNLYGTLAGIDFPMGQDKQLSFYLGYAGSKQEIEDVKSNQTGYVLGATGMIIKDKWYAGATANIMFNKASVDTDFGTDDIDMNMFSVAAKAGYNFNLTDKFTLEPSLTLMYGVVNSDSYETSQGAQIDSQSINNILAEPQVKAKFNLVNGWQPYGLLGYAANLSSKPTVKAEGVEIELDSIDGYVEIGAGANKDFIDTAWSCYAQVAGRSGGRNGFSGNLGIKYKF